MDNRLNARQSYDLSMMAACAVLTLLITLIDFYTASNYNPAILFIAAVALAAWTRSMRFLWGLTFVLLPLVFLGVIWGKQPVHESDITMNAIWLNRCLTSVAMLSTAFIVHLWLRSINRLEHSRSNLQEQHDELATREEEIARQNEELQSQTEELERQSEELRLANDELARRERHLQGLLDLSRSLTAGLSQDETMGRICGALAQLIDHNPAAAAILERHGDDLRIRCHHGLGSADLSDRSLPFEKTLARLVIERNQTGYIEDVALRPDLVVPPATDHGSIRSMLAAPLRVRGQPVGSVEVYSAEKQAWGEEQIAMVESLAAQASISLESAALFEEIERQRRRFETVFQTLPLGVVVSNAGGTDMRVNPAGAALLNLPTDANLATPEISNRWDLYVDGIPLPRNRRPTARALAGEIVRNEEVDFLLAGGRRATMLVSAAPIRGRDGAIVGCVAAFADITPLKELQRELMTRRREAEEASVRKTRFLAAVSHDIRTPANAISLMAELIRRTAANPALAGQVPQLAEELKASAITLVELVSDVLDVARFDAGKVDVQESQFSLAEVFADEGRHLQSLAAQKSLVLDIQSPQPSIHLRTDRIKLGRIVANLVSNAIKFTTEGHVRVRALRNPDHSVELAVSDTGIGIAPEHQAMIFDEFYQLRNPERDRNKGSGLGLAICKRLIDAMGGVISVQSELGQGSTFTVRLPASAVIPLPGGGGDDAIASQPAAFPPLSRNSSSAIAPTPPSTSATLAGLRVLLVEDHPGTRDATARLLANEGALVLEAPDGQTAFERLFTENPQVLLLDLMLPDMNGRDILRQLQQLGRPKSLRCILILTGDLLASDFPQALPSLRDLGADVVLPKPVDIGTLVKHLSTFACGPTSAS